jgi:hypothetical protein
MFFYMERRSISQKNITTHIRSCANNQGLAIKAKCAARHAAQGAGDNSLPTVAKSGRQQQQNARGGKRWAFQHASLRHC